MRQRIGFTLLELLVVVAIVGLLSAMLLPVFARERAAARDTQCMANVKAITTAIRMYAEEYEALWPSERDEEVINYFNTGTGGGAPRSFPDVCIHTKQANPYLRPAVVLERYLKSREVWKCPRAVTMSRAVWIVPPGPNGDWTGKYRDYQGNWGRQGSRQTSQQVPGMAGPCLCAFPTGWGGRVTDSFLQGAKEPRVRPGSPISRPPAFVQAIATNANLANLVLSRVGEESRYLVCGDCGTAFEAQQINAIAYPDTCGVNACGGSSCPGVCVHADWVNCPFTRDCGLTPEVHVKFLSDANYRKHFTRHSGGSNVGFLDGHAKWYASDFLIKHSQPFPLAVYEGGLCACWPGNGVQGGPPKSLDPTKTSKPPSPRKLIQGARRGRGR